MIYAAKSVLKSVSVFSVLTMWQHFCNSNKTNLSDHSHGNQRPLLPFLGGWDHRSQCDF